MSDEADRAFKRKRDEMEFWKAGVPYVETETEKETTDEPEADDFPAGWTFGYPDDYTDRVQRRKIELGLLDPNFANPSGRETDHKTST